MSADNSEKKPRKSRAKGRTSSEQLATARRRVEEAAADGSLALSFNDLRLLKELPANIAQLTELQSLDASETGVSDLKPIASLRNLKQLGIQKTKVRSLIEIRRLTNLRSIEATGCQITSLSALREMQSLVSLSVEGSLVTNLEPLRDLKRLGGLAISQTRVSDLSPLARANLQMLHADSCPIADISALTGQANLTYLSLRRTDVSNLQVLRGAKRLRVLGLTGSLISNVSIFDDTDFDDLENLHIDETGVDDLGPIGLGLPALKRLAISGTMSKSLAPLAIGATDIEHLFASDTPVADLTPLSHLKKLRVLDLKNTPVSDVSPLRKLAMLESLRLSGTLIRDVAPLRELRRLRRLDLDQSQVASLDGVEQMTTLATNSHLGGLHYEGTPISRKEPFRHFVSLGDPYCTVETINYLRNNAGMTSFFPENYVPLQPQETDKLELPRVPQPSSAAIEPVLQNGRITLPGNPLSGRLPEADLGAALTSLKASFEVLVSAADGESNIDKRAVHMLREIATLIPHETPPQHVFFSLAHRSDVLVSYARTVTEEWPTVLAAQYHTLSLQFGRTVRQFPKWREFLNNAELEDLTSDQLDAAATSISSITASLAEDDASEFIDPSVPDALRDLANASSGLHEHELLTISKEALVSDMLDSINNVLKRIAELGLQASESVAEVARSYTANALLGAKEEAAEQGRKDGKSLFKWSRKFILSLAVTSTAGVMSILAANFPSKFGWIQAVWEFFQSLV